MGNASTPMYLNGEAAGDLSSTQYHFVTMESDGQINTAGAGDALLGVQQDDPDAEGEGVLVAIGGVCKLLCDGNSSNITEMDHLAANSSGHGVKTTTDLDDYGAIALDGCTADGDIISVLVTPGQLVSAS